MPVLWAKGLCVALGSAQPFAEGPDEGGDLRAIFHSPGLLR